MRALLAATSAMALLLCLLLSSTARADVAITVSYTDVEHDISPNNATYRTERQRKLILTTDRKIRSTVDFGYGISEAGTVTLGKNYENPLSNGMTYIVRWSIENGAIIYHASAESYSFTMRISTNGVDACSAAIEYRLKQGHKFFQEKRMSTHVDITMDDRHVENVSCAIASVNH
jgi:hypothetical protein